MTSDNRASGYRFFRALRHYPVVPVLIIVTIIVVAIFADWIMPHDPLDAALANRLKPPFWVPGGSISYPLGTDLLGRDILSRMILGARASLAVSIASLLLAGGIGTVVGLVAGYYGRWIDAVTMRVVDGMMSFPTILLALLFAATLGPSLQNLIIVIALVQWAQFARMVRGEVLFWKTQEFVAYAKVSGISTYQIMLRHLFPNTINTLIVVASLQVGHLILTEASLSFLGVGVPPPTPAWGSMVAAGRELIGTAWWTSVIPGTAILLTVLAFNFLGDWLRDTLDPKQRDI